jgi:hypothetical protein
VQFVAFFMPCDDKAGGQRQSEGAWEACRAKEREAFAAASQDSGNRQMAAFEAVCGQIHNLEETIAALLKLNQSLPAKELGHTDPIN